ncbi:MAG: hypothetical protein A2W00_13565 [Candidatus Eisenbacteria bacterium RBG_16_71_46]|nr:MAG: hypothetical protein A2W00_13565 [Candidatus Eisenbacteria bacterium RBG_16_71_46]
MAEGWQRSFIVARGSFEVRVRDLSRAVRTLRWDVSRLPYLRLPGGRRVLPIGHKLAGLSEPSVAVQGCSRSISRRGRRSRCTRCLRSKPPSMAPWSSATEWESLRFDDRSVRLAGDLGAERGGAHRYKPLI